MNTKTYLFSFGTLQDDKVQVALYDRKLTGFKDVLQGYLLSVEKIAHQYPIIYKTSNIADKIEGVVVEISAIELLKTDRCEGVYYSITAEIFESGVKAWCYIQQK